MLVICLLVLSCARRVPAHLQLEPPEATSETRATAKSLQDVVALVADRDPLVRASTLPPELDTSGFPQDDAISAYREAIKAIERGEGGAARALQAVEDRWPGTVAVPLSRGYRLRLAENRIAQWQQRNEDTETAIAALLTRLSSASDASTLPKGPLEWAVGSRVDAPEMRQYGDQWVLRSWLFGPDLPLEPVARSLEQERFSQLASTPIGTLIIARATAGNPCSGEAPLSSLEEATTLALTRAAADRDKEQAEWAALRQATAKRLGSKDPIATLLDDAVRTLTPCAEQDVSAGGALLAITAIDWRQGCTGGCPGLERTATFGASSRWAPEIAKLARVWQVIALKESLDTMEVGHDTVLFPVATATLVDALMGSGSAPLDLSILRRRTPAPWVWLEIGRSIGVDGVTDWEAAHVALGTHLTHATRSALEDATGNRTELLERIQRRAIP